MDKTLKKFIAEMKRAEKRFEALEGEEREKAEKQLKNLEDRMQAEYDAGFKPNERDD